MQAKTNVTLLAGHTVLERNAKCMILPVDKRKKFPSSNFFLGRPDNIDHPTDGLQVTTNLCTNCKPHAIVREFLNWEKLGLAHQTICAILYSSKAKIIGAKSLFT